MTNLEKAFNRIDEYIKLRMKEDDTPGIGLALTDRDRTLRVSGYGYANLDAQTPVTGDTLFEIASIGKSFVSFSLLKEFEDGRLDLHKPASEYLPWFEVQSKYEPITVHHLLSATAGITIGVDTGPHGLHEAWNLRHQVAAWPPGSTFYTSNVGYKVLGFLLENVAGKSLQKIIQSHILDPLGMSSTHAVITQDSWRDMAIGYRPFYDDRPPHHSHPRRPIPWHEYGAGDGPVASTPKDMAKYVRMILNRGRGPTDEIVSEKAFDLMTQKVVLEYDQTYRGYNLRVSDVDLQMTGSPSDLPERVAPSNRTIKGPGYIGYGGDALGYVSAILADMNLGIGAAVMMNSYGGSHGYVVPHDIARFCLSVLFAAMNDQELPPIPSIASPTKVENAEEYAGIYRSGDRSLTFVAEANTLILDHEGEHLVLERFGMDSFYIPHQDFQLFALEFGRADGEIVEVFHGNDWFVNDKYSGPSSFDYPEEWQAYVGKYSSNNPLFSCIRVLLRKGMLFCPDQRGGGNHQVRGLMGVLLPPNGEREFGGEGNPERLRFDTIVDCKALRVKVSGADFYRDFTP